MGKNCLWTRYNQLEIIYEGIRVNEGNSKRKCTNKICTKLSNRYKTTN